MRKQQSTTLCLIQAYAPGVNRSSDKEANGDPPQNSTVMRKMAITMATTAIMTIGTKACIFELLSLSRSIWSRDRTFHFGGGIDLYRWGIAVVAYDRITVAPVI